MHAKAPGPTEAEMLHKFSRTCYFTQAVNAVLLGA